ncbi:hypothetical protein DEU56DRAFT_698221, partial [Suillus clintonianus]|uniref:uncharacterized protein n=1 Tax=Suillus clintonianus TaxID=1904413 RepID=UPI001B860BA0
KKRKRKPREREKSGSKTKANKADTDSDSDSDGTDSDTVETRSRSEKAQHAHTKHRRNNSQRVYVMKALMNRVQLYALTTAAATNTTRRSKDILIDSGCSRHMTPRRSWFVESTFRKLRKPIAIHLGDDSTINATGLGSIQCVQHLNGERRHLIIDDVLYAPDL